MPGNICMLISQGFVNKNVPRDVVDALTSLGKVPNLIYCLMLSGSLPIT